VWNQPWLKDHVCLQPLTDVQVMWDALTVTHLFKLNSKVWNENFIHYVFDPETASQILQTPLLAYVRTDKAIWRHGTNGIYYVCSAYRDILNNNDVMLQHRVEGHWNAIWKLKLPPKNKNFMWRICRNCLSIRVRFLAKGVDCPKICAICNEYDEYGKHLFFECSKSIGCQQRLCFLHYIQQVRSPTSSCPEMIFSLLKHLDIRQKNIFTVTLWSIWKH
jgi:hypothetical protein